MESKASLPASREHLFFIFGNFGKTDLKAKADFSRRAPVQGVLVPVDVPLGGDLALPVRGVVVGVVRREPEDAVAATLLLDRHC